MPLKGWPPRSWSKREQVFGPKVPQFARKGRGTRTGPLASRLEARYPLRAFRGFVPISAVGGWNSLFSKISKKFSKFRSFQFFEIFENLEIYENSEFQPRTPFLIPLPSSLNNGRSHVLFECLVAIYCVTCGEACSEVTPLNREVLHGVGADGVGVKFPIFAVNCCCLPLSFRRRREKRRKRGKMR